MNGNQISGRDGLTAVLPDGSPFLFWEKECVYNRILHVDAGNPKASDENSGSEEFPFLTIGKAAEIAKPGTKVVIHEGIYRECVSPAEGGTDPEHMISYEAAEGERVIIRASEEVTDFTSSTGWKLTALPEFSKNNTNSTGSPGYKKPLI